MRAADVMIRDFETIHPDALIQEVTPRLESEQSLPVSENQRLIGMINIMDIRPHLGADRFSPRKLRVRDVLAPEILYCLVSTEVTEAAALMSENHVRQLPVLDLERRLVGILTLERVTERSSNGTDLAVA